MSKDYYPFYFVSDLHGRVKYYQKLFSAVQQDIPNGFAYFYVSIRYF